MLAFSDVETLVAVVSPIATLPAERLVQQFGEILKAAGHPEAIDDGYETCPSRRIEKIVPAYRKRVQGPIVTRRIGIEVLRGRCTHFGGWLARLEQLSAERG